MIYCAYHEKYPPRANSCTYNLHVRYPLHLMLHAVPLPWVKMGSWCQLSTPGYARVISLLLEALECNPLLPELESSSDNEDDELIWDAKSLVFPVTSTIPTADLVFPCAALGGVPAEASGLLSF